MREALARCSWQPSAGARRSSGEEPGTVHVDASTRRCDRPHRDQLRVDAVLAQTIVKQRGERRQNMSSASPWTISTGRMMIIAGCRHRDTPTTWVAPRNRRSCRARNAGSALSSGRCRPGEDASIQYCSAQREFRGVSRLHDLGERALCDTSASPKDSGNSPIRIGAARALDRRSSQIGAGASPPRRARKISRRMPLGIVERRASTATLRVTDQTTCGQGGAFLIARFLVARTPSQIDSASARDQIIMRREYQDPGIGCRNRDAARDVTQEGLFVIVRPRARSVSGAGGAMVHAKIETATAIFRPVR